MTRTRDPRAHQELVELSGVVYGVPLRGRLPPRFRRYLVAGAADRGDGAHPLELSYRTLRELPETEVIWTSTTAGTRTHGRFALVRQAAGFGLTVAAAGQGFFGCTPDSIRIEWTEPDTEAPHYLFSYVLPLWLETRGVPVLHGSAVSLEGRTVAFVGPSGIGKSVLCAELLRLGCEFVADDALALRRDTRGEWRCSPGPRLLRLWPSGLESRLGIPARGLPKVHETLDKRQLPLSGDSVSPAGLRLAAVYILQRRPEPGGPVEVSPCRPREALVALIEHSVAAAPAAALGLSGGRLERLSELVEKVPVRALRFPSGADSAARIREAIGRDVAAGDQG